jgi:hypothetical protein
MTERVKENQFKLVENQNEMNSIKKDNAKQLLLLEASWTLFEKKVFSDFKCRREMRQLSLLNGNQNVLLPQEINWFLILRLYITMLVS